MKSEPKAFASLSSGLLARKGAARPAMRPQGFGQGGSNLDDLGWNDMGFDAPRPALASVGDAGEMPHVSRSPLIGLTPVSPVHDQQAEIEERFSAYTSDEGEEEEFEEEASLGASFASLSGAQPADVEDHAEEDALELVEELPQAIVPERPVIMPPAPVVVAVAPPRAVPVASEPKLRAEPLAKGKAAFTLRLDPSRHLKLRLACAVTARSAQQLVTRALDELLASMPELEAMAEQAPVERVSKGG
ncbi:hypothetical protein OMW55_06175 [Sphingomonas sp. BN140010]|uniref:Uncharacterized protein n=1 Tax=Sphingomonas arvum TaxID=2992113 RepID=A0ABT3JE90_9SPHN|nr:hypothetical protein [Sphingomonas sp. BN140010]MCW3797391.1 hypothetical protein [Sphingomonas sp. BN140010]